MESLTTSNINAVKVSPEQIINKLQSFGAGYEIYTEKN